MLFSLCQTHQGCQLSETDILEFVVSHKCSRYIYIYIVLWHIAMSQQPLLLVFGQGNCYVWRYCSYTSPGRFIGSPILIRSATCYGQRSLKGVESPFWLCVNYQVKLHSKCQKNLTQQTMCTRQPAVIEAFCHWVVAWTLQEAL